MRKPILICVIAASIAILSACQQPSGSWDRQCSACHDGKTVLNDKTIMNQIELKARFKNLDDFVNACGDSPPCMNILKHDKTLLRNVGKELNLP